MKQNWSRRELEAFGEPLGDSVTQRKLGGGYVCGGGGKGGGGSPPPASQSVTQTSIPEYARPYVEEMLGKSQALTDINQNPYQAYGGQRISQFSPLQQQAFANVASQTTAGQLAPATQLAGAAGLGSLGVAGQAAGAGQRYADLATSPQAQQAYMSPYMQNVVEFQKSQAIRDYARGIPALRSQAVGQGAFGGSRMAIQEAEAQRNLMSQLQGIEAAGSQKAFEAAQQAQQYGAGLGLQGYGTALQGLGQTAQAAGALGQLGQTQFGQQQAISQAQQQVGAVQQAQAQQALDLAYQDYLKQRNYPYQQLAFMSDMLRGLPLSQSAQQIYTAPPNLASQLGGLGMAGLGIYGMSGGFKGAKGGLPKDFEKVKGYATGGDIKMLSTEQLEEMLQNPSLNPLEIAEIEKQLMLRRRIEANPESDEIMRMAGITSIPTGDMVPMEQMAGGGIVAFAAGSKDAVQEDPVSNKEYREFLRSQVMERLKGLQGGPDPFAESKKAEADTRAALAEKRRLSPYEALAMGGFGAMSGTSRYGLTNIGLGGIEALKTYGRAKGEEAQMEKALMQQGIEREKAKYGRDIQNLNALQTSLGQMDAREIAAMNQRTAQAGLAESRRTQQQVNAQRTYDAAVKAEKDNLFKQNKQKYNMDYTDPELDAQAIANVNKRLSPAFKSLLFPEGMPAMEAAPAAPAAAPAAASGAAKKGFNVVVQGKTYTFPTQEAADTFKKRAQAATTTATQ